MATDKVTITNSEYDINISHLVEIDDKMGSAKEFESTCQDGNLNDMGRIYEIRCENSKNPTDWKSACLEITGKIIFKDLLGVDREFRESNYPGKCVYFPSGWIYTAFESVSMYVNGYLIEKNDNLSATIQMYMDVMTDRSSNCLQQACLWKDQPKFRTYLATDVFPPMYPMTKDNKFVTIRNALNNGDLPNNGFRFKIPAMGEYNTNYMTHCVREDGSYRFLVPLSVLFQSLASFETVLSHFTPTFKFERTSTRNIGFKTNINNDEPTADDVDGPVISQGPVHNIIQKLKIIYNQYTFSTPKYTDMNDAQYKKDQFIMLKYRVITSRTMNYAERSFRQRLPLNPSKHGNRLLLISFNKPQVPTVASKTGPALEILPITLSRISLTWGGAQVIYERNELNDRTEIRKVLNPDDTATANDETFTRSLNLNLVYEDYCTAVFECLGIPREECPSYSEWLEKPYIAIPMINHKLTDTSASADMINIVLEDNGITGGNDARMMNIFLITNEIASYNPVSNSVIATGGQ